MNFVENIRKEWWWVILGGIGIVLVALVLRLYSLTILPIFADEAIYVRWAQVMKAEPSLRFLPLSDGKQPLFMWGVIPFLKLFQDPLFAGRFVSVLSGLGTLFGIFLTTNFLFKSKKAAIVASFIYAISPFSVFFDRMALTDSMLTMFGIWVYFFGVLTARTMRLDFAMLAGFALGGALLTKSPALFFVILLPSVWLIGECPKGLKNKLVYLIKVAGLLGVTYLIGYGMYNILRLGPNFNMIGARNQDYVSPISHLWTNPRDPFVFFFDRSFEWVRMMGPKLVILLALFGLLVAPKKNLKATLVVLLWFIFPILVQSEFAKVYTARYILFSLPYLFILAGLSVEFSWKFLGRLMFVFVALYIISALKFDYLLLTNPQVANLPRSERSGYLEEWTSGYGIKEVADYIRGQYQKEPNKTIVVGTEGFFGTLPDGLQIYLNDYKNIIVVGVGLDISKIPQSLKDSKKAGNQTFLVVNSSRFMIKKSEPGLRLIAAYPKAKRLEKDTHEYIWYGERDDLYFFEVTGKVFLSQKERQE